MTLSSLSVVGNALGLRRAKLYCQQGHAVSDSYEFRRNEIAREECGRPRHFSQCMDSRWKVRFRRESG